MLPTAYFYQLAPSPFGRLRNNFRICARQHLPFRLKFLIDYDVSQERIDALRAVAPTDAAERELTAHILLFLFEGEYLQARGAIHNWLHRKGGANPELEKAARRFVSEFMASEANDSQWLRSA